MVKKPNRVARCRKHSHLSRAGVADRLGVTERTVYRWERGETQIPDDAKLALADMFGGVTVSHLMGWDDEPVDETGIAA